MWKSGFKWMFLIIGTTIGAGYASGRELWEFFGHGSGLAIVLFVIFFVMSCNVIMTISYKKSSTEYRPVLKEIVGKKLSPFYDVMIFVYLYTTTVVMMSGSGATGQAFNFPYWWGIAFIAIMLVLLFLKDISGLLSINQIILPILIFGLLYVLLTFIHDQNLHLFSHWREQHNWPSAFPFTALNILPLIAVLGAVGDKVTSKQEIWIASIGSGLTLGIVTYVYNNSLIQIAEEIIVFEIPLFAILSNYPFYMVLFMSILLWFAIFTTAASGVLGITTRLAGYFKLPFWLLVAAILATMIPLTTLGFSTLVSILYPLYGLLNLYVLTRLLLFPLWNKNG
ncbi:YkvI family membrane protein [Ornithinibacillus californiensis]|uniref:YkvI family membrane protein n=1 Tax=Ornithinibacillus californiensis TaxID=161536 RepID=UPI00064D9CAA|nr:membrane protein [Ornithinibacillus californiensis]